MTETATALTSKTCKACAGLASKLDDDRIGGFLAAVPGWTREGDQIARTFAFKNYYQTMAFVNATAWISHREDHHPDLLVGYNSVRVTYSTHSVGGLTENDFICAAKINALELI